MFAIPRLPSTKLYTFSVGFLVGNKNTLESFLHTRSVIIVNTVVGIKVVIPKSKTSVKASQKGVKTVRPISFTIIGEGCSR